MERIPVVYLLASRPFGTLYVGVTSNLRQRVWQHRQKLVDGFTRTHDVHRLVWYEVHESMEAAIAREKTIKRWRRAWKIAVVQQFNPTWRDLYEDLA